MESAPTLKDLYIMLREQIQHEDHLVNHRLTWLLAVEGYLFAVSAALLTSQNLMPDAKISLFFVFGFFGISFCFSSLLSIRAAHKSLQTLRDKWDDLPSGSQKVKDAWIKAKKEYPPLTYVGNKLTNAWTAAEGTPWLIFIAWFVLMGSLLFGYIKL